MPEGLLYRIKSFLSKPEVDEVRDPYQIENSRRKQRRKALDLDCDAPPWGLALSGGGIRSATFALGVLQAMAEIPLPETPLQKAAGKPMRDEREPSEPPPFLGRFDFLSTVSGGGYIGGFLCSLFVPGRLNTESNDRKVAENAYRVLRAEPPGRMRQEDDLSDSTTGKGPMAWLRENGRYLTPTGSGDYLYALTLVIRNLIALYYVLGTLILFLFSSGAAVRAVLTLVIPTYAKFEGGLIPSPPNWIWLSPFGYLAKELFLFVLPPIGAGFWLSVPIGSETKGQAPRLFSVASSTDLLVIFAGLATWGSGVGHDSLRVIALYVAYVAATAFAVHGIGVWMSPTLTALRTRLTWWLANGLKALLFLLLVAAIDTVAQSVYFYITHYKKEVGWHLSWAAAFSLLLWLIRHLATVFDEKSKPAWLTHIPANFFAGIVGMALLISAAAAIDGAVIDVAWRGGLPALGDVGSCAADRCKLLAALAGFAFFLAGVTGLFPGFINLSSLQSIYGARLCRAYLGASNSTRFKMDGIGRRRRVAEPMPNDDLPLRDYYGSKVLAPIHLINVTLNETVDPGEQLVQRDRKGRPLCISPAGFAIDGKGYRFRPPWDDGGEVAQSLSLSTWLGTSGAAISTGLGRSTRLGLSLALGLANLRLGRWWASGVDHDQATAREKLFRTCFKTQTYLLYELLGKFHGLRRPWQYLSDGGHFENTGVYELLRPQRGIKLIVLCDSGCDQNYRFEDVSNLIRLARIDYGLEIEVDTAVTNYPGLGQVFGTPADFTPATGRRTANHKCALLFNVFGKGALTAPRPLVCRIVVLKPSAVEFVSLDVQEYAAAHPAFPQEPTSDQFFDEAQWESYRRLGYLIASRVFGPMTGPTSGYGAELLTYL